MSMKRLFIASWAILAISCFAGCGATTFGPKLGPLAFPIPVSPYFQSMEEDQHWEKERYDRVPVLGPLTAENPEIAMDPPSDDQIMRALERAKPIQGGMPLLHTIQRKNVRIIKEKIADYVDPPRVYPLIGPARLHHAHYKCTVYYSEVNWAGWPVPHRTIDEDAVEIIYIDKDHFHMVGNVDTGVGASF